MTEIYLSKNVAQSSNFDNQTEKAELKRPLCKVTPKKLILKPEKTLNITIKNLSDKRHEFRIYLHSVRFSLKNARTCQYKAFVHTVCDGGRDFSVSIVDRAMFCRQFNGQIEEGWEEGKLIISQIEANKKDELIAELLDRDRKEFPARVKVRDETTESRRLVQGFVVPREHFVETPLELRETATAVLKVTLDSPSDSYKKLRAHVTRMKMITYDDSNESPPNQSPAKDGSPQEKEKDEPPPKHEPVEVPINPESSTKEDTSRPTSTPTRTPTKTPVKKAQTPKREEPIKVCTLREMMDKKEPTPTPQALTPTNTRIVRKKKKKKCTIL